MSLARQLRRKAEKRRMKEVKGICSPLESLSDELIEELVSKGWDRKDLEFGKREGLYYNRKRNSSMSNWSGPQDF